MRNVVTDQYTIALATRTTREANGIACPELMAGVRTLSTPWLPLIYALSPRALLWGTSDAPSEAQLGLFYQVESRKGLLCSLVLSEDGTDLIMNGVNKLFCARIVFQEPGRPTYVCYHDIPNHVFDKLISLTLCRTSSKALCSVVVGIIRDSRRDVYPKV